MVFKKALKKNENWIWTALLLLAIAVFAGLRYDYYYDLNDDVLMKDILSGAYTGTPEGHNIQMLWPVSAFISLFYRIARGLPWYGIFLCVCHYGSLGLIVHRSLGFCRKSITKLLLLLTEGLLITGLFLNHLVCAQYTITCTLLACAAAFLFFTTDSSLPAKEFIWKNAGAIALVAAAYLIRSEMLLLVLPLICMAGAIKWGREEIILTQKNALQYLTVIGAILIGILAGEVTHRIAYGTPEWKKFTEYFDNRTELYDFQVIPEYEKHQAFYEEIGLTESERELLDNYNFGLDEEIDEKLLGQVAEYAAENRREEQPFLENLKESLGNYARRTLYGPSHNESDYPWNYAVILGYAAVFAAVLLNRKKRVWQRLWSAILPLLGLGAVRTGLWMFIIMRQRAPARITHSLYLMELCILAAMLFEAWRELDRERIKKAAGIAIGAAYGVLAVCMLPLSIAVTDADVAQKEKNNLPYEELYPYLSSEENKEHFYFIDVYSFVSYTEKMFVNVDNSLDNYDIMGGWANKSPLWRKKLEAFSISNMEEALLADEAVFYVQKAGEDTGWLSLYYEDHDTPIRLELIESLEQGFEIYRILQE